MLHHSFHKLASGFLAVSLLLSSCARLTLGTPTATTVASPTVTSPTVTSPTVTSPTAEPTQVTPPGATLTSIGRTQEAVVGSYCWITNAGNASTTTCAETAGVPTAREPLVIVDATSFKAHFNLEILT